MKVKVLKEWQRNNFLIINANLLLLLTQLWEVKSNALLSQKTLTFIHSFLQPYNGFTCSLLITNIAKEFSYAIQKKQNQTRNHQCRTGCW